MFLFCFKKYLGKVCSINYTCKMSNLTKSIKEKLNVGEAGNENQSYINSGGTPENFDGKTPCECLPYLIPSSSPSKTSSAKNGSGIPVFGDPDFHKIVESNVFSKPSEDVSLVTFSSLPNGQIDLKKCMVDRCSDQCSTQADLVASNVSCKVEVLSLNEIFPSTSENVGKLDEFPLDIANTQDLLKINHPQSKPTTSPRNLNRNMIDRKSDISLHKNTSIIGGNYSADLNLTGSHSTKKINKQTKKLLRHREKYEVRNTDRKLNKLALKSILKEYRLPSEYLCDTPQEGASEHCYGSTFNDLDSELCFSKQHKHLSKGVKFNAQVIVIHFTGGECGNIIGQSVETLCKENDQQARNSELRQSYSMFRLRQYTVFK